MWKNERFYCKSRWAQRFIVEYMFFLVMDDIMKNIHCDIWFLWMIQYCKDSGWKPRRSEWDHWTIDSSALKEVLKINRNNAKTTIYNFKGSDRGIGRSKYFGFVIQKKRNSSSEDNVNLKLSADGWCGKICLVFCVTRGCH